jgi:hypothetical protein
MEKDVTAVEMAREAYEQAYRAFRDIEREQTEAESLARQEVRRRFAERLEAARKMFVARKTAFEDAKITAAAHPWEGKKVWRDDHVGWAGRTVVRIYGVVQIRVREMQFPANAKYLLPQLGEPFVRLLTKDGKPGLRFETMREWKLVEEGEAND